MSHPYLYLKLLLRSSLLLELDEYELTDTREQGLVCSFMETSLASAFQPVYRADGKLVGREALLRARWQKYGELPTAVAFDDAVQGNRVVQFDRLVRIIHLMNHARNFAEHELLFLNVHPRLLSSVSDHGRTFERILHFYSVPTSRVVIEIKEAEDDAVLAEAVSNYRSLGYRIALDDFAADAAGVERLTRLKPDIVKLDSSLIRSAADAGADAESFGRLVSRLRRSGTQVAIKSIETSRQLKYAAASGVDLLQGYQLGRPQYASVAHGRLAEVAAD